MTDPHIPRRPLRRPPGRGALGAALAVSVLLLAACGGGGGGYAEPVAPPAAIDAIPGSAGQSAEGLASYLTALAQVAIDLADTREPLSLGDFAPSLAEDAEPMAVNVPGA